MSATTHSGWFARLIAWVTGTDRAPLRRVVWGDSRPAPVWPQADQAAVAALGAAIERATADAALLPTPVSTDPAPAAVVVRRRADRPLAGQLAVQARLNVRAGSKPRPVLSTRRGPAKAKPVRKARVVTAKRLPLRPQTATPIRRVKAPKTQRPTAQIVRLPLAPRTVARGSNDLRRAA